MKKVSINPPAGGKKILTLPNLAKIDGVISCEIWEVREFAFFPHLKNGVMPRLRRSALRRLGARARRHR
jgi:hypothetical protein